MIPASEGPGGFDTSGARANASEGFNVEVTPARSVAEAGGQNFSLAAAVICHYSSQSYGKSFN